MKTTPTLLAGLLIALIALCAFGAALGARRSALGSDGYRAASRTAPIPQSAERQELGAASEASTCPALRVRMASARGTALREDAQPKADEKKPEAGEEKPAEAEKKTEEKPDSGCIGCHANVKDPHEPDTSPELSCVACHGGDGKATTIEKGHVQPHFPKLWATSANPVRSYALLNRERPEFIQFVNPGDLRVADKACGGESCHGDEVLQVRKSMMTHGGMLWGAALYNNGAFPLRDTHFGESYSPHGVPQRIQTVPPPTPEETRLKGILPFLDPLPRWEISQPGNVLRVFERGGGRRGEIGIPLREEEGGRPDDKLSDRGYGTLLRTDPVFLGLQKTRLLDPILSFLGTNDNPGDYRSSGCSACHVIYANDRDPEHSGPYASYGNLGHGDEGKDADPMISNNVPGHPIHHAFTNAIPSSQCMTCHVHPGGNMVASYYGTTWWDNETDGEEAYPSRSRKLTASQIDEIQRRNPEGSALRGKWSDPEFLAEMSKLNPKLKSTQFADFHGHGWVFRNVYKQDRKGNLLDKDGKIVAPDDPEKWAKAVHLKDIHLEKGMHCIDCHFRQDVHGNAKLYNEPRAAIEITCSDCHGTIFKRADPLGDETLTTGPAGGNKLKNYNITKFGDRFEKDADGRLWQHSAVDPGDDGKGKKWELVQVLDTITPGNPHYSEASRLAKTMRKDGRTWGSVPAGEKELAHRDSDMTCFACHSSWMTSCFGCHLPMSANRKKPMLHNEGDPARNWTAYNFQVLRDDVFMLGRDGTVTGHRVAPVRSSSAVLVSSQNQNREWIYAQQQTVSAEGYSGQAFSSHVPHTVRAKETKQCTDCHVSQANDNNAWMAQLLLLGTNFVNFMGRYIYVGEGNEGFEAVVATERDEPQAVIGSHLHRLAYPERYREHEASGRRLEEAYHHEGNVLSLQLRGEYLYTANGPGGLVVYDVANIDNKGFSERMITAPVSPAGQRFYVRTRDATAVVPPTTLAVDPARTRRPENEEQPIHPFYAYLYVADRQEGLIVVGAATLLDGDPTNNFLRRAATFNPGGVLNGAVALAFAGHVAYIACDRGIVVVDLEDPIHPRVLGQVGGGRSAARPFLRGPRAIAVQFRYAFVCDEEGLKVLDISRPEKPAPVRDAVVRLKEARDLYVARTYAYVAAGSQGLAIVDVERPEQPRLEQLFNAEGAINDAYAVRIGMTNASLFAYVADGPNGLRVLQLTTPGDTPGHFGFSPRPMPRLIATYRTRGPALTLSKGLDRDRAVDEEGHQIAVFGRRGARPFNRQEIERMYLHDRDGQFYAVTDDPPGPPAPSQASLPALMLASLALLALGSWLLVKTGPSLSRAKRPSFAGCPEPRAARQRNRLER